MSVWTYQEPPWEWNGNFALNAVAGKHPRQFGMDPRSYDDMLPGCHDIGDRIKNMDIEGVWAQLCSAMPATPRPAHSSPQVPAAVDLLM